MESDRRRKRMQNAAFSADGFRFCFEGMPDERLFFVHPDRSFWMTTASGEDTIVTRDRDGRVLHRRTLAGPHRGKFRSVRSCAGRYEGKSFHAIRIKTENHTEIWLASLDGADGRLTTRIKIETAQTASISPNGRLLVWIGSAWTLQIQRIDSRRWTLGPPTTLEVPLAIRGQSSPKHLNFGLSNDGAVWIATGFGSVDNACVRVAPGGRVQTIPRCIPLLNPYPNGDLYGLDPNEVVMLCEGKRSVYRVRDGALAFESIPGKCRCLVHGNYGLNHALSFGFVLGPGAETAHFPSHLGFVCTDSQIVVQKSDRRVFEAKWTGARDSLRNLAVAQLVDSSIDCAGLLPTDCLDVFRGFEMWAQHHNLRTK